MTGDKGLAEKSNLREGDMRRRITVISLLAALVTIGSIPILGQRAELSKERLPFQEHLFRILDPGVSDTEAAFNAPFGRRVEIHNVNTILALGVTPEHAVSMCVVRYTSNAGGLQGHLPIILKRPFEPGSSDAAVEQWFATQPTLLHVFPYQTLECRFSRFPASGLGSITWTISGFTEFVQ